MNMLVPAGIRSRMTLVVVLTVTVTVITFATTTWLSARRALLADIDYALSSQAAIDLQPSPHVHSVLDACADPTRPRANVWLVDGVGRSCNLADGSVMPAHLRAAAFANNGLATTVTTGTNHRTRIYSIPATTRTSSGRQWTNRRVMLVSAHSLEDAYAELRRLATLLAAGGVLLIALATFVARALTRAAVAPLHSLAQDIEHVTHSGDRSLRTGVPASGDDIALLAERFNSLLDSIEAGELERSRLIGDASHELRTPLLGIRTNIELLRRGGWADEDERNTMLDEVTEQVVELVSAVEDLVRLAREHEEGAGPDEQVDLAELVIELTARARRHFPHVDIAEHVPGSPVTCAAIRSDLARAINNLLDNACRWAGEDGQVVVNLDTAGTITVNDSGPGFRTEDLPHVFERFYRSPAARSMPGTGLGLSIVRAAAARIGGSVSAANAEDGGAAVTLHLPALGSRQERFSPASAAAATIGVTPSDTTGTTMSDTPTQPPPPHEPGEVRRHLNARIPLPHIRRRRPDGAAVRTCLGLTLAAACGAAAYTLVMGPEHIVDIAPLPLGSAPTAVQAGTPATPIRSLQTARSESMYAPALSTSTLLDSRMAEEPVTRVVVTVKAHAGEERDLRLSAVAHVLPEDQTSTPTTGWPNNVALDRVSVGVRLGACTDSSHALLAQVPVSTTDKPAQRSFRLPAHTTYRNLSIWIEDHGRRRCMNPSQVAEEYNDTDADAAWFHARCGRQAQVQLPGLDSRLRPAGSPPGRSLAAQRYPDIELPMDPLARASAFPRGQCRKIAHRLAKAWRERLGSAPELGYFWDGQLR